MPELLEPGVAQTVLLATFFVRDALCGLDAAKVQEVVRVGRLTTVRHAPASVLGIMNLRGRIVTILDIGLVLGTAKAVTGSDSRVFIIEDGGEFLGLLVDHVCDVVEVEANTLEPAPANLGSAQARFFRGVHRANGRVIAMLDVSQLVGEASY